MNRNIHLNIGRLGQILTCVLVLLFFDLTGIAQGSISFQHYSAMHGLPDNRVNTIIQDQDGFIWIGTNGGLCRFDGHEFLKYYYESNNPNSVCGNYIKDLTLQSNGTLWIATGDGGLCSLDKDRKTFKRYPSNSLSKISVNINCLLLTKDESKLYLGMENAGIHYLDLATGITYSALPPNSPNSSSVYDILEEKNGVIYYGQSAYGIRRLINGESQKSKVSLAYPHPAYAISCFFKDSSDNIWMGAWSDQLFKLNSFDEEPERFPLYGNKEPNLSGNEIVCINESSDNMLWLGTKMEGLFIYDSRTSQFTKHESHRSNPLSLKGNSILCIYRDRENRMWIGSEEGVNIYDPQLNEFDIEFLNYDENCQVYCFHQEGDSLYIGTEKGLFIKHSDGLINHYTLDKYFDSEEVRSMYRDQKNRLWIGTQHGIYHWNNTTKNINRIANKVHPAVNHNHLPSSYVTRILEYQWQGKMCVWAFVLGYGCLVYPDDESTMTFIPSTNENYENLVRNVYIDSKNRMWITGAILGASIITNQNETPLQNRSVKLQIDPISSKLIGINNAFDIIEVNNKLWFGSRGRGLINLPINPGETEIKVPENIPRNIQGLNTDLQGNIWFISALGIGKFSAETGNVRFFDNRSGVPTEGLNGFIYKDKNNILYCGGNGYFIKFNPNEIKSHLQVPKLLFTHFQVMDKPADSEFILNRLYLNQNENTIKITATSLNFTNPSMDEYIYKLDGLYDEWISNGTNNVLTFAGLPPGDYKLAVRTKNSEGVMSESSAEVNFTIIPPFYRTGTFYVMLFLIVAAIAYTFYTYRVKQLLAILKMRNKIARDLHDDVGSTLGSISIYSEAIKQQLKGKMNEFSEATLEKIGSSSRLMIEQMSDIVWSVDPQHDTMEHLVERMQNFGSDLFAATHMYFSLNVDKDCFSKKLDMEERKSIFLIYKEALYNSLKYSNGSEIKVTLKNIEGHINLNICDNGKGFNPDNSSSYNGNGLRNMAFRAKNINATLHVKSEEGWGTDITLILS